MINNKYCELAINKLGSISGVYDGRIKEYKARVYWECRGCVRKGDILVALKPGPWNVLLRRCAGLGDLFEVVGWGSGMKMGPEFRCEGSFYGPFQDGNESRYYLAEERFQYETG